MSDQPRYPRLRATAATAGRSRAGSEPNSALQAARMRQGWSQPRAIEEMLRVARRLDITTASPVSLKAQLSRWENGQIPEPTYRRIFRQMYGLTDAELGFTSTRTTPDTPPGAVDVALAELAGRLRQAERVDAELITLLASQTHQLRLLDRRFGGAVILDQMGTHVQTVSVLLTHTVRGVDRAALARVLADAGTLAGWQALDTGAAPRAWGHFNAARTAAIEAGQPELLAHALGEQAYALLELGRAATATELIDAATATKRLPPLLRAWLAAARGEMLAATGQAGASLRAFDTAHTLLPDDRDDDTLPFLALDEVHLARWRGNALARLGSADAIDQLTGALALLDPVFTRAACTVRADLATAYAAAGEREQAIVHARGARQLAVQIRSERILRRLDQLRLPDTPAGEQG